MIWNILIGLLAFAGWLMGLIVLGLLADDFLPEPRQEYDEFGNIKK